MRLGKTEMMVTRLGFGGIPIQRLPEEEAIAVVKRCLELGINFLDTANGYTTSEDRIGKAIAGQREGLILATKSLARTREEMASHLKLSLERLGVDYIDLYQFHNVSDTTALKTILDPNGPIAVLEEARRAGVVRHIGLTSHQIDIAKEAVKSDRFETIMFPFNFIAHEPADELLPLTKEHDVGFIAMKPMGGGMFDHATIAFKYLLQFLDAIPIVGIETVPEIEEIVQVLEQPREMTADERREMERIRQELGTKFCRRCDYCQPCQAEIQVSLVMAYPSLAKRMPSEGVFSGKFAEALERAANCTECGECEERCPYHLTIRETMSEHYALYQVARKRYQEQIASR